MIFKITKFILRRVPDKWRSWLMIICMMESALVRPGQSVEARLTIMADGSHDFTLNDVEWSESKKDRARSMLANFYSDIEVAEAMGVPLKELHEQLKSQPYKHNNLNDCNAAGCDGVQCERWKGDF